MANYGLELPAKRISLDPVSHIASIASACSDCIICVYKWHILFDVFKTIFEVFIRSATPFAVYA